MRERGDSRCLADSLRLAFATYVLLSGERNPERPAPGRSPGPKLLAVGFAPQLNANLSKSEMQASFANGDPAVVGRRGAGERSLEGPQMDPRAHQTPDRAAHQDPPGDPELHISQPCDKHPRARDKQSQDDRREAVVDQPLC